MCHPLFCFDLVLLGESKASFVMMKVNQELSNRLHVGQPARRFKGSIFINKDSLGFSHLDCLSCSIQKLFSRFEELIVYITLACNTV